MCKRPFERSPMAVDGYLDFFVYSSNKMPAIQKRVGIERIHLEMDSGKSTHNEKSGCSLIDLNRAGVGLIEIVTLPEFANAIEATCFVGELRDLLIHIGVCQGQMEKGQFRMDANISLRPCGEKTLGIRTEVKNLNSLKALDKVINSEIDRQKAILNDGGRVKNETRMLDLEKGTVPVRDKETGHDYRFMPEPNLPPLRLSNSHASSSSTLVSIASIRDKLPLLLSQIRAHLIDEAKIDPIVAIHIARNPERLKFVSSCLSNPDCPPVDSLMNRIDDLAVLLNRENKLDLDSASQFISPECLIQLTRMVHEKEVTLMTARGLLKNYVTTEGKLPGPREIVMSNNHWRITDARNIRTFVMKVINENPNYLKFALLGSKKKITALRKEIVRHSNKRIDYEDTLIFLMEILNKKTNSNVE